MTNEEAYQELLAKKERGEPLTVVEQFLFEQETKRRQERLNDLQRLSKKRAQNPLLRRGVQIQP